MANLRNYTITIGKVYNGDVECTNPTVTIGGNSDVLINCIDASCGKYNVQVGPNDTDPCITFIVECEECGTCPPQTIVKCLCDSQEDCGDCEICNTDGFCDALCDPEFCDDGVCQECLNDDDCECNQVCDGNGNCACEGGRELNPLTGCCDECSTSDDCEDCEICQRQNGVNSCVPKDCPGGVPKIGSCDCVDCNNSGDCEGPNECCTDDNECECCEHYVRVNGVCTWYECLTDDDCGDCEFCDDLHCTEVLCEDGGVCNPLTNGCEPPCDPDDLDPGFGILNGFCTECDTLSCAGEVSECSQAQGCECDENDNCVSIDCNLKDCVSWEINPPIVVPGTVVPGTGVPAPSFTVVFTELGLVPMSGGSGLFLDYQITITETNGNSGTWTAEGSALGSGSSITFNLSDPTNIQWNNVGFEVIFNGALGQTGSIVIFNQNWFDLDPAGADASYFADLLITPANWVVDVQGEPVLPETNGSSYTPGSYELCPCGENTTIVSTSWTTTEGNLTVSFIPLPNGCRRAIIQGCGTGEGTVTTDCAGILTTVALPELPFDFSGSNCCDPLTDPNCDGTPNDGFGCDEFTVVNGDIALTNTNYTTGDGYGLFRGVFQPDSIGYSVAQWIRIARTVCWSVTGTVREATSFIPPVLAHLFHDVEYRTGVGCLRLGYNCDIKIADCKKVQAEACFNGCDNFSVEITGDGPTYTAVPSMGNPAQLTFAWTTNTTLTSTSNSITVPDPNTTVTTLNVTVTLNVNGVTCIATATKTIELDAVPGCTNTNACNYDSDATVDDGSCVLIANPSYDCALGFLPGFITGGSEFTITYRIGGTSYVAYDDVNPGTYDVDIYFDGVLKCTKELVVPQCYRCVDEDCIPSPLNDNKGPYTTIDCDGGCACDIEIVVTPYCNNNQTYFVITATGDTGVYSVTVTKVAGPQFLPATSFTDSTSVTTGLLCNGVYNIVVTGENCSNSVNWTANCFNCSASLLDVTSVSYNDATNVMSFTIVGDPCSSQYAVQIAKDGVDIVGLYDTYGTPGAKTLPFGYYRGDGVYTVRVVDDNGCVRTEDITLNVDGTLEDCPIAICSISASQSGSFVSFAVSYTLDASGGLYSIKLYSTTGPGNCAGAVLNGVIDSITNQPGVIGINNVNFTNAIAMPFATTCYAVKIEKQGTPSCFCTEFVSVDPSFAPPACDGSVTFGGYDESTGEVVASWSFTNTSNDMTIEINAYPDAGGPVGTPVTVTTSGNGAGGSMVHIGDIPQIQGQDQYTEITIYDTNDPTCTDTIDFVIPGCTCEVEIVGVPTVDLDSNEITINVNTTCTSGDVDVFLIGDVTETQSILGSTTGITENQDVIIVMDPYPSTGGTVDIEVTDNIDGGCTQTMTNVVLPENCVGCTQVASLYLNTSVVTQIRDEANNLIVTGAYDVVTNEATLETDTESGTIAQGGNFCSDGVPVDVANSRGAGIKVTQDSTDFVVLNHALVTNADWVGTKKFYFGDCGCDDSRVCDYEAVIAIAAGDDQIDFYYGISSQGGDYSGVVGWGGMTQTPSGSFLTGMENDILNALTNLSGCDFEVGSVSVSYDTGADELTISIAATDAAIGVVQASNTGVGITTTEDFTQSGCV